MSSIGASICMQWDTRRGNVNKLKLKSEAMMINCQVNYTILPYFQYDNLHITLSYIEKHHDTLNN